MVVDCLLYNWREVYVEENWYKFIEEILGLGLKCGEMIMSRYCEKLNVYWGQFYLFVF